MAYLPFISKSDLEILKALTLANDINRKCSPNSLETSSGIQATISSEDVFVKDDTDSQATSTFSSASDDFTSAYRSFKFDPEYETVRHDVDCINVMCDLFIEKNQLLEMEVCSLIKNISSNVQEILSTKHLNEILEQINNTVEHMLLICDGMYRIQQVLQEKPYERTLKVNPACQKAVLEFFTTSNEIINKLQQQIENTENYRSKNAAGMETYHKELQSTLHNKILELAKRTDIISQFRDRISPASTQNSGSTPKAEMLLS